MAPGAGCSLTSVCAPDRRVFLHMEVFLSLCKLDFTKACKIGPVFSRTTAGTPPIKCLLQSVKGSEEFLREKLLELLNLAGECYFCCPQPRTAQVIVDIN